MASYQSLCFLSLIIILIQFGHYTNAQPSYRFHLCEGGNYTNGTTFQSNLNLLLSSLSSIVDSVNNGFSNNTIGRNPNQVHGLFLCAGNLTTQDCENCVETATEEIPQRCPNKKEAIVWYDECMLRYSNRSIFSVMEENPTVYLTNTNNVSDPNRFRPILKQLMEGLVSKATNSSLKFSTGEANFNSSQKIYGSAQCTPDLSPSDCNKCLQNGISQIPSCCDGKQGGRVLQPSCNVRYELYDFYGTDEDDAPAPSPLLTPGTPPPPPSPPTPPSTNPTPMTPPPSTNPTPMTPPPSTNLTPTNGKGKNFSNILLTVVATLVLSLMLNGDATTQLPLPSASTFLEHSPIQSNMPTEDRNSSTDESEKSTTNSSRQ